VQMAMVTGHVANPDGTAATNGNVNLVLDAAGNQIGANFGGRIQWDGGFTIANVPPGRYLRRARSDDTGTPLYAALPISVNGADARMNVVLMPGATLSGTASFPSAATAPPDVTQFRITAPSLEPGFTGAQPNARLDSDGKFVLTGVPAGTHLVRAAGNARGWTLKSVMIGGRDVTDIPIELRSGESVGNLTLVFTDKVNEISGTVADDRGTPASEYTVLAFSTNSSYWRPLSRQIATARPDQTGKYRIRTLPPGEYYVVTVDPTEQGEWFEPAYLDAHRLGAARVTLSDGDVKTQDFTVRR
jgi:Carboxypeptidase regulatory-like domain